jgi:hypothetical protein
MPPHSHSTAAGNSPPSIVEQQIASSNATAHAFLGGRQLSWMAPGTTTRKPNPRPAFTRQPVAQAVQQQYGDPPSSMALHIPSVEAMCLTATLFGWNSLTFYPYIKDPYKLSSPRPPPATNRAHPYRTRSIAPILGPPRSPTRKLWGPQPPRHRLRSPSPKLDSSTSHLSKIQRCKKHRGRRLWGRRLLPITALLLSATTRFRSSVMEHGIGRTGRTGRAGV